MTAGRQQDQIGEFQPVRQPRRQRMTGKVVHPDQRQPGPCGDALGAHDARQDAADEARPGGDRHRVEVAERDAGLLEGAAHGEVEGLGMGPRRHFGHDAAKARMQRPLAPDHGGQDLATSRLRADDRGGGVVAAAFDAEECQAGVHEARSL